MPEAGEHDSLDVSHHQGKQIEAKELVSSLTLKEKVALCSGRDLWYLKKVRDLPPVVITDGPHGVRKQSQGDSTDLLKDRTPSTCFPTACTLACSWDTSLLRKMGVALAKECIAQNVAVLLGPGMNIKRHPCGGRNFEYFSEDPHLSGTLASALVKGVQSLGVGSSVKHFSCNNQETGRMRVDVRVDERTLREVYWRGFEIAVKNKEPQEQPWTIMCAYNRVNGVYCSEHEDIWDMVRNEWGFQGAVMTDWGATNDRVRGLLAGVDLEMPGSKGAYDSQLYRACKSGKISLDKLNATVTRNVALTLIGKDVMERQVEADLEAHHTLARQVAMESAVLLKNDDSFLPLAKNTSIAVIGEFAKFPRFQGMGSSQVLPTKTDCAWDRLQEYTDTLVYAQGYDRQYDAVDVKLVEEAVEAAKQADVVLVFCGLPEIYESEAFDRPHMNMPANHNALIEAVCAANSKVGVVLSHGAPVTMPWVTKPRAILDGYLAGQAGGSALVDLVFGVASPCGKLAETFPLCVEDVASNANFPGEHYEVQYREGLNVGYRHFDSGNIPVLFPFGHGLTYTEFEYSDINTTLVGDDHVDVTLTLHNVGSVRAAEIVQCYIHDVESTVYRPEQELKAFTKVWLDPGEHQQVEFLLDKRAFAIYDVGVKEWIVEPGAFEIRVGASSRNLALKSIVEISAGQAPSARACEAHPPVSHCAGVPVTDKEFQCMLGIESLTPPDTAVWPFHHNTLLHQLECSFLGKLLRRAVYHGAQKGMDDPNDRLQRKLMKEMCDNIPLRGLVIFSQGAINFHDLAMILALMNWRFIKFFAHLGHSFKERRWRRNYHPKHN